MNSKLNIGITICVLKEDESVWNNGIKQNAVFLAKTFMASQNLYNVYIVNTSNVIVTDKIGWNTKKIKTVQWNDIKDKLDIIFPLGGEVNKENTEYLRKRGCKVVPYKCGNEYIISMENVIFDRAVSLNAYPEVDQIWNIPQMENTNHHYWRMLHRSETITIPFVWDPMFLDAHIAIKKREGKNPYYNPSTQPKRISVFEPNINVYKYCVYPILIMEEVYRKDKSLISTSKITNTQKIRFKKEFIHLMKHLDIVNDGKMTFEDRFPIVYFLSEYTDIVLAHQWENALNYAYLDALYLNYPLVHNAHLCKDAGYYYEGFNVSEGAEKLMYALTEHDKNIEEYNERSRKTLRSFKCDNPTVVKEYDRLLGNLFSKDKTPKNIIIK